MDDQPPNYNDENQPLEEELGMQIPGYSLVKEINRGGQAVVFQAIQKSTGRKVAIKLLLDGPLGHSKEKARMEREARILATLDHPNIVSIVDKGKTEQGWTYFIMDYVKGRVFSEYADELRSEIARGNGHLKTLLRRFISVCEAVGAAHNQGIVHRDIKPDNIIIDTHDQPNVLDFGVAHTALPWGYESEENRSMTDTGEFLGSLAWASPEQAEGDPGKVDMRSDVYSLGLVLYEAVTGVFPYDAFSGSLPEKLDQIIHTIPELPGQANPAMNIPEELDRIIMKALSKDRNKRYQTASEMAEDLFTLVQSDWIPSPSDKETTTVQLEEPPANHQKRLYVGLGALAGLGLLFYLYTLLISQSPSQMWLKSNEPLFHPAFGYHWEGDEVVFQFNRWDYDKARHNDSRLLDIEDIPKVHRVFIAGEFNNWVGASEAWEMNLSQANRFVLRKHKDDFPDKGLMPFKFVINGEIWVSAPMAADNKEPVYEDASTFNLLLHIPGAPLSKPHKKWLEARNKIKAVHSGYEHYLGIYSNEHFYVNLTTLPTDQSIANVQWLKDIPVASFNAVNQDIAKLESLFQQENLVSCQLSEWSFENLFGEFLLLVEQQEYTRAIAHLQTQYPDFPPIFQGFRELMIESLQGIIALQNNPEVIPPTAKRLNNHHYLLLPRQLTWNEARTFATTYGATPVCVNTATEQRWLTRTFSHKLLGQPLWSGGTDEFIEGGWGWLTSEEWSYSNWTDNEPNALTPNEDVMVMRYDGFWQDSEPDAMHLFTILEWD